MYNDKNRLAELFGFWQTDPFKLTLTADGHIPMNKYGNLETFNGPLPPECRYANLPKIIPVCKKLQCEYVPAVIGFEIARGGSHPVVKGVVMFKTDYKKVKEEC